MMLDLLVLVSALVAVFCSGFALGCAWRRRAEDADILRALQTRDAWRVETRDEGGER